MGAGTPSGGSDGLGSGARRFDRALALEDSGYTTASASVGDVNRDGKVAARFKSDIEPDADDFVKAIDMQLNKK